MPFIIRSTGEKVESVHLFMEPAGVVVVVGGGADVQRTNSSNLRDLLRIDADRTNSAILLDFLRIKQEDCCKNDKSAGGGGGRNTSNRHTLGGVLRRTSNSISNGTIIDYPGGSGGGGGGGGATRDIKKNWRDFGKRLKLGGGSSWTSSMPVPAPVVPLNGNSNRLRLSELLQMNASQALDRGSSILDNSAGNAEEDVAGASSGGVGGPVRMSLMALLAEADPAYIVNDNGVGEGEEEVGKGEEDVGKLIEYNNDCCCVCMVRHKGAAFIPCGHTFCRLCSRELYVQRGTCPLCNNLILEILDIF